MLSDKINTEELCSTAEFDAKEFIAAYRRRMPLSHLQKCLQDDLNKVRLELVHLINENYSDFVRLSTEMQAVERKLNTIHTPLKECTQFSSEFREGLGNILEESHRLFAERKRISDRKAYVHKYLENKHLLEKIETSLKEERGFKEGGALSRFILYENVAKDLLRVRFNLSSTDKKGDAVSVSPCLFTRSAHLSLTCDRRAGKNTG
eukprot:GDKI01023987.1.p1 GENE.GDKI01023987.1~~GDKI01023987.1.p1  ORF type:complete len:206 (-),score=30.44 GDKI01023987.1:7-624(-)